VHLSFGVTNNRVGVIMAIGGIIYYSMIMARSGKKA